MVAQDVAPNGASEAETGFPAFRKFLDKLADFNLFISCYIIYPLILIVVTTDVMGRNFFQHPLSWAIEGSGLFLVGGIFLAIGRVELDNTHIMLDMIYDIYPRKMKLFADFTTRIIVALWMGAATLRSGEEIFTAYNMLETGADFTYPFWPMRVVMTLGFFTLTLCLLFNVLEASRKFFQKEGGRS